jgi:two-component sensor histidine kinase
MTAGNDSEPAGGPDAPGGDLVRALQELTRSKADLRQSQADLAESRFDLEQSRAELAWSRSQQQSAEGRLAESRQALSDSSDASEQRELLSRELSHRLKNSLAVAQAIAAQTFRGDPRIAAYNGRLAALGAAQDLLLQEAWAEVPLLRLVERTLSVIAPLHRFRIGGDSYRLDPRRALSLSLALHELGTNALKYGALSNDSGSVTIDWTAADGRLDFSWREQGGPPVEPPTRTGFGTRLITSNLESDFDGAVEMNHHPDGIVLTLSAPV